MADRDSRQRLRNLLKPPNVSTAGEHGTPGPGAAPGAVLVVGCGTMGQEISRWVSRQGISVGLVDPNERLAADLARELQAADPADKPVPYATDVAALASPEQYAVAIETVVEQPYVKQEVLAALEKVLSPNCLLTTNTSTLSLSLIGSRLQQPERLLGLHFLLPVAHREAVEVVTQPTSPPALVEKARRWVWRLAKLPLVVGDETGFLVNRLLFPVLARAVELWLQGLSPLVIDRVALQAGFGWGPFLAMDAIGLETVVRAGAGFWRRFPERFKPSPILPVMVKRGRLGRKAELGVYRYPHSEAARDPFTEVTVKEMQAFLASQTEIDHELLDLQQKYALTSAVDRTEVEIEFALRTAIYEEILRVVEEGYVTVPDWIDAAWIFGLGYSSPRGGPLEESLSLTQLTPEACAPWMTARRVEQLLALARTASRDA